VSRPAKSFRRVQFLDEAADDMRALADKSRPVLLEVLRLLKLLDLEQLSPTPLHDFSKTGDLSDCGKIVVAVEDEPEVGARVDVVDVIAVEHRTQDLPYILAGLRLGRITDPVRRSDAQRRVARIRSLLNE
jgi:hypothetical protein